MRSLPILLAAGWLAGCGFQPSGGPGADDAGGGADAPVGDDAMDGDAPDDAAAPPVDATVTDAAITDAAAIDAAPPIDASPADAMRPDAVTDSVLESITVPVDGTVVTSQTVLTNGVTYTLRASGTATVGPGTLGDAEYYGFNNPQDGTGAVDVGLAINDLVVDATKIPDWGPYQASHIYTVQIGGLGTTITAKYFDPNYTNNSGSLTLQILAP